MSKSQYCQFQSYCLVNGLWIVIVLFHSQANGCSGIDFQCDVNDPQKYFVCVNGAWLSRLCSADLVWDTAISACNRKDSPSYVACLSDSSDEECIDGAYECHDSDPHKFYKCYNGVRSERTCPSGSVFTLSSATCVLPDSDVDCEIDGSKETRAISATTMTSDTRISMADTGSTMTSDTRISMADTGSTMTSDTRISMADTGSTMTSDTRISMADTGSTMTSDTRTSMADTGSTMTSDTVTTMESHAGSTVTAVTGTAVTSETEASETLEHGSSTFTPETPETPGTQTTGTSYTTNTVPFVTVSTPNNTGIVHIGSVCSCYCTGTGYFNANHASFQKSLRYMRNRLNLNVKLLSSTHRRQTCAGDTRMSSQTIGYACGVFVISPLLLALIADLSRILTCKRNAFSNSMKR